MRVPSNAYRGEELEGDFRLAANFSTSNIINIIILSIKVMPVFCFVFLVGSLYELSTYESFKTNWHGNTQATVIDTPGRY